MHPDEVSLLRTACEKPDDDAPRLVYADWLDDTGDDHRVARAEFIRVQIRLEQLAGDDPRRRVFEQRAWQLLHDHNPAWLAPMGMKLWGVRYRRGFIERATTRSDLVLADAGWFALQPFTELELQLDWACWQLVLDMLARLDRTQTDDQLQAAWQRACANDPRLALIEAGGQAAALGWHPLVERARNLRLSVAWQQFSRQFGQRPLSSILEGER
jgi:uncharacterized protein (TIGR02996 family)